MNAEAKFVASVMDARLKKAKRERDAYKKQRDELINDMAETKKKGKAFDEIDDLIVLRANKKRLERENAEQLALLKQFRKLIDYKLSLHQGSLMYREYRSKLDQLGVK
ncbi:hypothetical protein [Staphylococcus pettenkoferi]|uniref:hypothetical protein n=1 Tax=Staphylococcus pettenkoferi TaxID=170573 RepID=UPI0025563DC8|nr:hypothetical protein [Staphylococcus pettenkoferi]MDK7115712.1 hypothetical protein [Staphylococcus pettenkoferi]